MTLRVTGVPPALARRALARWLPVRGANRRSTLVRGALVAACAAVAGCVPLEPPPTPWLSSVPVSAPTETDAPDVPPVAVLADARADADARAEADYFAFVAHAENDQRRWAVVRPSRGAGELTLTVDAPLLDPETRTVVAWVPGGTRATARWYERGYWGVEVRGVWGLISDGAAEWDEDLFVRVTTGRDLAAERRAAEAAGQTPEPSCGVRTGWSVAPDRCPPGARCPQPPPCEHTPTPVPTPTPSCAEVLSRSATVIPRCP